MQLIATYGTKSAAQQVYTKRTKNNNSDPRARYVICKTTHGYQLWTYTVVGKTNGR